MNKLPINGDLDFIYEGRGPKVVPTFAVIPGLRAMGSAMQRIDINLAALLHGEQSVTTHRPLPAAAEVTVEGRIAAVWDKGKAAVIEFEGIGYDNEGPLFEASEARAARPPRTPHRHVIPMSSSNARPDPNRLRSIGSPAT